jgi:hypothetical protein
LRINLSPTRDRVHTNRIAKKLVSSHLTLYPNEGYTFELLVPVYSRIVASVAICLSSAHVNMNYCIPTVHLSSFLRPSR